MPTALAVALALAAAPQVTDDVRGEVRALLGVIDRPVAAESFRRFGAAGEAALADIALSRELTPRRGRALEVLASLGSPRAEEVHHAVARAPGAPPTLRRTAVLGLGRLLPADRVRAALRPYLASDPDAGVRAAAAEALAGAAPASACGEIRLRARAEAGRPGAASFRRALAACDRAKASAPGSR